MAREERRLFEIIFADELEDAVVEVEAVAGKCRDGLGKLGGVRVLRCWGGRRAGLLLLVAKGGERGLDAEAAFAFTAFSGGFFWSGEGEEANRKEGGRWRVGL